MQMDTENHSALWEQAARYKQRNPHPSAFSTSSTSSQSDASSTFSQNDDSPPTSLSSQNTSPSLSQASGKGRRSSEELSSADEDLHEPCSEPALKKCKLRASDARTEAVETKPGANAPKAGRECAALRMSRTLFVENLVDVAVNTIASIWGRFSRESRTSARCATQNNTLPLDLFVREILRRSRTSCSTLQAALLYCIRCKEAVNASVEKMADATDGIPSDADAEQGRLPSLSPPHALGMSEVSPEAAAKAPSLSPLLCGRRMFLAAVVVASKFLQDRTYSNRTWSKISGLNTKEIEQLERVFLHTIQYDLVVDASHWSRWTSELSSNWGRAKQALATPGAAAQQRIDHAEMKSARFDTRLHRAHSENVLGQALPFDAGLLQADRTRAAKPGFARHESAT